MRGLYDASMWMPNRIYSKRRLLTEAAKELYAPRYLYELAAELTFGLGLLYQAMGAGALQRPFLRRGF